MNRGIALAGMIVRYQLNKQAGTARKVRRVLSGARRAWNEGATAIGGSVGQQLSAAGKPYGRRAGKMTTTALKAAPIVGAGYLGYRAFEPEVHSAKRRLGEAVRGRVALFKARRRAVMPYYHEGRFQ